MNRNFHRIVFNAARGLRMVVQETARSTGRGARKATGSGTGAAGAALGVAATLAALAGSAPLHAQIHADPNAPGRQRATVLLAPNGVPLVNIQTPSAAGVSRNVYRQFDIDANGVILNNSRTSVQTRLGGVVAGNPWLARGPARVIVNEVNSNDPTYLRGFVEVAGSRADVIVANPSGISVNGGGFINAYRATLTTGVPQYGASGGLEGYLVRGGTVTIGGAGLDASATDTLAILARAFALSASLHAADLKVVAGANRIDADLGAIVPIAGTGATPAYAIDVAHLGGMYAGHIALVVNEAGVGARNAGAIQTAAGGYTLTGAGAGRLTLSASGRLENSGLIQGASDVAIEAAGLANGGTVRSASSLAIATRGDLVNHAEATGGTLEGARVELASAEGDIDNRGGTVRQTSAAALVIAAARLSNTQAGFVGAPPPVVTQPAATGAGAASGGSGTVTTPQGGSGGGGTAGSGGTGDPSGAEGAGGAGATPAPAPIVLAPGTLTAAGTVLNDGGRIHAGGDVTLRTPVVDNAGGVLRVATMAVSGPAFGNAGGTLHVTNAFTADVGTFDNAGGTLRAGTLAIATTGGLDNRGGTLASDGVARLRVGGRLDNARGIVSAVDALDVTVAGAVDNTSGRLLANAAVSVTTSVLDNTLGAVQSAGGATRLAVADALLNDRGRIDAGTELSVQAGSLANTGAMRAERDATLAVTNGLANDGGIVAGRDTTVAAGRLDGGATGVLGAGVKADGTLAAAGDLSVTTTGSLTTAGTLVAAGHIAAQGASVDLTGGKASGANIALTATTGDVTTRRASVTTPGTLHVRANASSERSLFNDAGTLDAGRLDLQVANLRNTNAGRIVQTGGGATTIAVAGTLDNDGGTLVSNGADLRLAAATVRNGGGVIQHAGTGTLEIGATRAFSGAKGRIASNGALDAHGGDFDLDGGATSARQIAIAAGSLSNRSGEIVQTGTGVTRIATAGALINDGGTIATNGTDASLSANALSNAGGRIRHAGTGTLGLAAGRYGGTGGEITSKGDWAADVAGAFDQDGGTTTVRSIALSAGALSNRGGTLVQTGDAAGRIELTGALDNIQGVIASSGDLTLAAASLANRGGSVRTVGTASLDVTTNDLLDNADAGVVGAARDLALRAGRLSNDAGSITAVRDLGARVSGALSNVGGTLAANGGTTLAATTLDNTRGTVSAVKGDLVVTTTGLTTNTLGTLQAAGRTALVDAGLVNTQGKVTGRAVSIDTNGGALDNTLGTLAAATILDVTSGALTNDRGLVQSGGAMTVDTHGQTLVNTNAAGHTSGQGGIASGGTLVLNAGAMDNTAGFVGAKDTLAVTTGGFTNAVGGVVLGQADVAIATNGATWDNRGGRTLAVGDLKIDAGGGVMRNGGALIRSGGTTRLMADTIDNAATLGADQGIEGRNVDIVATKLDNTTGAIRADANASITSASRIGNANGLMSAGDTLSLLDPNRADPTAKTLSVVNTNGRLLAGKSLMLDAATFSGDGTLTSGRDLAIALTQDLVNDATVSAAGDLSYATTGRLTNHGQLLAGRVLTVSGRDVENTASGVMRGDTTIVKATSTLTNHGLIDGRDTRIDAGALVNGPTGRIYGDHLSIAAGSVLNDTAADGSAAGTIAAREVLDIGAGSIVNRRGALVLSGGGLHIGGALDAKRQATGSATLLSNQAATIEALGDMAVNAKTLENKASGVSWTMKQEQKQVLEFSVTPGGQRFKADEAFIGSLRYQNGVVSGWTAQPGSTADLTDDDDHALLLVPSPDYPLAKFKAYYLQSPARSRDTAFNPCTGETTGICTVEKTPGAWYAPSDPIWSTFGVAPPARDLPPDHPLRLDADAVVGQQGVYGLDAYGDRVMTRAFDHPVTQAEIDEGKAYFQAHEDLDMATDRFIAFNGGRVASDYYIWQYTATTRTPVLDRTAEPARIVAGGAMTLTVGGGTNDMGQILAGGELSVRGGAIKDTSMEVQATGEGHGTVQYSHIGKRGGVFGSRIRVYDTPTAYDEVLPTRPVILGVARQDGHTAATSAKAPEPTTAASVDPAVGSAGGVTSGGHIAAIIEVPMNVPAPSGGAGGTPSAGAATGIDVATTSVPVLQAVALSTSTATTPSGTSSRPPTVVRTATPDATIPRASLFKIMPGPSARYLVETDPAFADYRTWLSSDYLLKALSYDPTTVTKRLGDGFHEQRLVREQVAQLTGYRFLEGFGSDTDQYTALMDAGATFAQRYQLTPGIALTAAQMAQLTSDIVWLVEQTVTLADGSTERVLVPQVYVRVRPGDIDGAGALLSGEHLTMKADPGRGDVVNTGTLAGRTLVSITADNIRNLGGRIASAGSVQATARTDLDNLGGMIDADNAVVLKAGQDIHIASTSQTAVGAQSESTQLGRLAGVYVTNPGGTLVAQAGRDIALVGAILSNTGAGSATMVKAGRDITLDTVKTSRRQDIVQDEKNHVRTAESAEVGTRIVGGSGKSSSVSVLAGGDIVARQITVQTGGLVALHADGDIELQAGRTTSETDSATQSTQRKFLGKTTTTTAETRYESLSQGSRIEGNLVSITANGAITGEGVKLKGDDGVLVQAGGPLDLHEARDIRRQSTQGGVTKSGIALGTTGVPVPDRKGAIDTHATSSDTAAATTVESRNGGALLKGGTGAVLRGVEIDVAKKATVRGATVSVTSAIDEHTTTDTHEEQKSNHGSVVTRSARGVDMHLTDTDTRVETSLARSTIRGANVDIKAVDENGKRGELTLAGTTVRTPGTLTLEASRLLAPVQLTQVDTSHTSEGRDLMWQRAQGEGGSDPTANYTEVYAGKIVTDVDSATIETGAKDSIDALVRQPGMGWVDQLRNDPALAGKVDWKQVDDAYKGWDHKKEGLTPEGAGIVVAVVTYLTWGAASGAGAVVGEAAAVSVGEGVALAGGAGTFVSAGTGMAISGAVGGAVAAGMGALASQAAVALINNQGNLGRALHDLGSSQNVKGLLAAIATGSVLGGMNLNPTGLPTAEGGAQKFMTQLGQNLQVGLAKAVIGTAINGGSLGDSLKAGIKTALLDTMAAQGANAIGDISGPNGTLDAFANKVAHAIAGCAVGVVRTDTKAGCGAGAIGAAVGEMAAEAYGRRGDTVQFASMMGGIAAALGGADAQGIGVAGQAGANAAANNYVSHSPYANVRKLVAEENAWLTQACGAECTQEDFTRIDAQMQKLESAAQVLETQKRSKLTSEQAVMLGENIAALLPVYGVPTALYQAITGESLSGNDLSGVERFFNGVAAALPMGGAAAKLINSYMADLRLATSVGGIAADGTALMDFSKLTTQQKGVVGELLGATTVQNALPGATRLGRMGEVGSQGIDDLYKVSGANADYVIVEYKFGTSKLSQTADGLQMSDDWVSGSDRILKAVDNNLAVAESVDNSIKAGRVEKWVVHTDPAGGTSIWIVDSAGKITKADSSMTSKVLGNSK